MLVKDLELWVGQNISLHIPEINIINSDLLDEEDSQKIFLRDINNIKFIQSKFQTKEMVLQFIKFNNGGGVRYKNFYLGNIFIYI